MARKESDNIQPPPSSIFALTALAVAIFCGAVAWFMYCADNGNVSFGDAFQGLSALFSGWAFIGLIYTALLQKRELTLQKRDLELTRDELEGQRKALDAQSATFKKQSFEDTFFRLLSAQGEIVNSTSLYFSGSQYTAHGRDCFTTFYQNLRDRYSAEAANTWEEERVSVAYLKFYSDRQAKVGHYFRNLYTLVKFVDRSDVSDKKFYTNIVRAQLSSHELLLLFYNCLSPYGKRRFKPLVERYALLEQIPKQEIFDPRHLQYYEEDAYGQPDFTPAP
jgi:hypothetical protein